MSKRLGQVESLLLAVREPPSCYFFIWPILCTHAERERPVVSLHFFIKDTSLNWIRSPVLLPNLMLIMKLKASSPNMTHWKLGLQHKNFGGVVQSIIPV